MRARAVAIVVSVMGLAATACGGASLLADTQRAEGTFDRTLEVNGSVSLDVSTGSGSVVVRSGAGGRVVVEGRVSATDVPVFSRSRLSAEERVRRLVANPPVEHLGQEIRIGRIEDEDLRQHVSISYTITVPADTSVLSRTGSGSQTVDGLRGAVDVSTGSGSVRVHDAGGSVRAHTGSGSIAADRIGGPFEARAGSGSIEGTEVKGDITVKTGSGRIRMSQAGPGDVEASTGSGSIDLSGIRGAVRASTGSGSLAVRGEQTSDWRLETSSGSVTVALDGTPAFDLDASGGRVDTTYPITVTGQLGRNQLRGSVNGGGPLLRVHTSSGRITIR